MRLDDHNMNLHQVTLAKGGCGKASRNQWPTTSVQVFGGQNAYREEVWEMRRLKAESEVKARYGDAYRVKRTEDQTEYQFDGFTVILEPQV